MDVQRQRHSTLVTVVGAVAGDGHCAVDGQLMLFAILCYVERVWRKLKERGEKRAFGEFGWAGLSFTSFPFATVYHKGTVSNPSYLGVDWS